MKLWGFISSFILVGFVLAAFVLIGISFHAFQAKPFVPKTITPQPIVQRTIDQSKSQLAPVRNLVGTWAGTASLSWTTLDPCTGNAQLTLVINNQTEDAINGTVDLGAGPCTVDDGPGAFNAGLTGTRINNFAIGGLGTFSGSYTKDTITLNQTTIGRGNAGITVTVNGPINLLRQ